MTDYLCYKPEIARRTDVNAAVLFAFLEEEERTKGDTFTSTAKEIYQKTMLSSRQQKTARRKLLDAKLVTEKISGMPASLHYSIPRKAAPPTRRKPKAKVPAPDALRAVVLDVPTVGDVMDGLFDDRSTRENKDDKRVVEVIAAEWATIWNKNPKRATVSTERKKAWEKAMADGHAPSDFLKAVYGMRHDTWTERKNRNGWTYVHRHIERWIELYDEKGRSSSQTIDTKEIKGVVVPASYEWSQEDEHLLQMGKRFDIKTEKWK